MAWNDIVCVMCETVTDAWVVWGAAYTEPVYYFCCNACLARWIIRGAAGGFAGSPSEGGQSPTKGTA
jgi:hypothetical protein